MSPNTISSPLNPSFRQFCSLLTSKGIKEYGKILLSGEKLVSEFLQSPNIEIEAEIIHSNLRPISSARNVFSLAQPLFDKLDDRGTGFNLLVLKAPHLETLDLNQNPVGLEVLLPLGDPNNLGAAIRSSMAFGAKKIVLLQESAHPFLPKSIKASSGSVLKAPLYKGPSIKEISHGNCESIYALTQKGQSLNDFRWPKNLRLIVGEEGQGIPPNMEKNAHCICIPMENVESLNAMAALSIALHSFYAQCQGAQ
jgi:RNA methyltransferase, TrmH family